MRILLRETCRARYYTTLAYHTSYMFTLHVLCTLVERRGCIIINNKKTVVAYRRRYVIATVLATVIYAKALRSLHAPSNTNY